MTKTNSFRSFVWLLAVALASLGPALVAQPSPGEIEAVHIVRPGDSLRGITAKYLGSPQRWEELWRLNPEIVNPDVLKPGQRIRVLLRPSAATPTARILSLRDRSRIGPRPSTGPKPSARICWSSGMV